MGRNLILTGVALVCLLGVLTGSAEPQAPHVWHVDDDRAEFPEADYVSIQDAVEGARSGDMILVHPGTYRENVQVDKSLEISSASGNPEDAPVLQGTASGEEVFLVTADSVSIRGFSISGKGTHAGIYLEKVRDCSVCGNLISGSSDGIVLVQGYENQLLNNNIRSAGGSGIALSHSESNLIAGNSLSDNYRGVYLLGSTANEVKGNTVSGNSIGIYLSVCGENTFSDNLVYGNCQNVKKIVAAGKSSGFLRDGEPDPSGSVNSIHYLYSGEDNP